MNKKLGTHNKIHLTSNLTAINEGSKTTCKLSYPNINVHINYTILYTKEYFKVILFSFYIHDI